MRIWITHSPSALTEPTTKKAGTREDRRNSKLRDRFTDKHLQNESRLASFNIQVKVNICDLIKDKQYQV
jgi:hypothetical protein